MLSRGARITLILPLVTVLSATTVWAGTVEDLANRGWILQSFGPTEKQSPLIPDTRITLWFNDEEEQPQGQSGRTLRGSGGCNSYIGSYKADEDGTLSVKILGWTDMACFEPPGVLEQEAEYLTTLDNVSGYEIEQGHESHLRLFYDYHRSLLSFVDVVSAIEPSKKLTTTWASLRKGK